WYHLELGPWMGRPLSPDEHARIIVEWRRALESAGKVLATNPEEYELNPETAPEWELRRVRELRSERLKDVLMRTFTQVRTGAVQPPSGELPPCKTCSMRLSGWLPRRKSAN